MTPKHHYAIQSRRTLRHAAGLIALRILAELMLARVRSRVPGLWRTEQVLGLDQTSLLRRRPVARLGCRLLRRWNRLSAEDYACFGDYQPVW